MGVWECGSVGVLSRKYGEDSTLLPTPYSLLPTPYSLFTKIDRF